MFNLAKYIIAISLVFCFNQAQAFTKQKLTDEEKSALIGDFKPVKVSGEAIAWEVFAKTTANEECSENDGLDYCITKPGYSPEIKKLDGKTVTLMGFMFPLEQSQQQQNFLLGPYPLSCPFHYHVGPSQIVEVKIKKGIKFSYDPITIKGTLKLRFNEDTGIFYYLEN